MNKKKRGRNKWLIEVIGGTYMSKFGCNKVNKDFRDYKFKGISSYHLPSEYKLKKNGILLDDVNFVDPLLDHRYTRIPLKYDTTIGDFMASTPIGTYLITIPGHITVIRDQILYGTFDCRNRFIQSVWKVC